MGLVMPSNNAISELQREAPIPLFFTSNLR
jgi:hypothetical protein